MRGVAVEGASGAGVRGINYPRKKGSLDVASYLLGMEGFFFFQIPEVNMC